MVHLTNHESIILERLREGPIYKEQRDKLSVTGYLFLIVRLRQKGYNIKAEKVPGRHGNTRMHRLIEAKE